MVMHILNSLQDSADCKSVRAESAGKLYFSAVSAVYNPHYMMQ